MKTFTGEGIHVTNTVLYTHCIGSYMYVGTFFNTVEPLNKVYSEDNINAAVLFFIERGCPLLGIQSVLDKTSTGLCPL